MVALRCTQRLLRRLSTPPVAAPGMASNALGHWYANVLTVSRTPLVHAISERSLLSVVLPGAPFATIAGRFPQAMRELLQALAVPENQIECEISSMAPLAIAATASRQVLGCLNQYMFELEVDFEYNLGKSLLERELWLSENISSVIRYGEPRQLALELLAGGVKQ